MSDGVAPQRIGIGSWPVGAIEIDGRVCEDQPGRVSAGQCQMDVRFPGARGKIQQELFSKTNHSTLPVIVAIVKGTCLLQAGDAGTLRSAVERRLAFGRLAPHPLETQSPGS